MTVREGGHDFVPGGTVEVSGRQYKVCDLCKQKKRAAAHQPPDPRSKEPEPVLVLAPRPYVIEPREVKMLRLAVEALLELPTDRIGWTLRQRAQEIRRAVDLPPDEAPAPVVPVGAEPTRTTLGSQKGTARWVRKAISGAYWEIAAAALDQGFTPERKGSGHIRFRRDTRMFSLSTTVQEGRGRGFENAKAAARRAGVEV